jgi:membrane protease YdiL (CAAX protease family)
MRAARRRPLLLWLIAIAVPFAFLGSLRVLPSLLAASTRGVVLREAALIGASLLALGLLARVRTVTPAALGLRRFRAATIGWGLACGVMTIAASVVMLSVMQRYGLRQNPAMLAALGARPAWLLVLMALTAAISEEVVFRAVMIPHVAAASRSTALGVSVSLAAFALAHAAGWGWAQVLFAAVPGAVLTAFFLWRRDLWVCVTGHFLTDMIGLMSTAAHHAQGIHH